MKIKNKFILSLIILCFCICSFSITLILRPFNKSIVIMVSLSLLINHVPSAIGLFLDHLKSRGNIGGVYG